MTGGSGAPTGQSKAECLPRPHSVMSHHRPTSETSFKWAGRGPRYLRLFGRVELEVVRRKGPSRPQKTFEGVVRNDGVWIPRTYKTL